MDGGNMKYLLANGTGPMSDKLIRNFRHFLWLDKVVLVIDDWRVMSKEVMSGFGIQMARLGTTMDG